MEKKVINIYEYIQGNIIIRQINIDIIQKELQKALVQERIKILNSSFNTDYLFNEDLIYAVIEDNYEFLEKTGILSLTIYYDDYNCSGNRFFDYPSFIYIFIKNYLHKKTEIELKSLDIDEWDIVKMEVE